MLLQIHVQTLKFVDNHYHWVVKSKLITVDNISFFSLAPGAPMQPKLPEKNNLV